MENIDIFRKMARCGELKAGIDIGRPKGAAISAQKNMEIYIPIQGLLDLSTELARLKKEGEKLETSIGMIDKKLKNREFVENAPKDIVDKERAKYEELMQKRLKIEDNKKVLMSIDR
jgi:valyl-tRNA synthetase